MTDIVIKRGPSDPEPAEPTRSRELPLGAVNPHKDGEYYDRCVVDGCVEVDRIHKVGGVDGHGQEHLFASIYSADMRQGGCGALWSRTTPQGEERYHKDKNLGPPKWRTRAASRTMSVPSEQFSSQYERIFGHS